MHQHFGQGVLSPLAKKLIEAIESVRQVADLDGAAAKLAASIRQVMALSPSANDITDRFWFDLGMIDTVREEWSACSGLMPPSILPRYGARWEYTYVPIPSFKDSDRICRIDLLGFPDRNAPEKINLLQYPWLYHELGHLLMRRDDRTFEDAISRFLDDRGKRIGYGTLALSRAASHHLEATNRRIDEAWRPRESHEDWAHEIAIDIIAVWCSGPAFIAAYVDVVETRPPYIADEVHPPYELRTRALIEAATRLGWRSETQPLEDLLKQWEQGEHAPTRDNIYVSLAEPEVMGAVVSAALEYCSTKQLPRCTKESFARSANDRVAPDGGLPLFAAACQQYNDDHASFGQWQSQQVAKFVAEFRH